MTDQSKNRLLKTAAAVVLMMGGAWGTIAYDGTVEVLAVICIVIGFAIIVAVYGWEWMEALLNAWL